MYSKFASDRKKTVFVPVDNLYVNFCVKNCTLLGSIVVSVLLFSFVS